MSGVGGLRVGAATELVLALSKPIVITTDTHWPVLAISVGLRNALRPCKSNITPVWAQTRAKIG